MGKKKKKATFFFYCDYVSCGPTKSALFRCMRLQIYSGAWFEKQMRFGFLSPLCAHSTHRANTSCWETAGERGKVEDKLCKLWLPRLSVLTSGNYILQLFIQNKWGTKCSRSFLFLKNISNILKLESCMLYTGMLPSPCFARYCLIPTGSETLSCSLNRHQLLTALQKGHSVYRELQTKCQSQHSTAALFFLLRLIAVIKRWKTARKGNKASQPLFPTKKINPELCLLSFHSQ